MKENILEGKKMETEKNTIIIMIYYLKENIQEEKDGLEK